MTTFNTGNPVPSGDGRDRFDNTQTFDELINSPSDSATTRLGKQVKTVAGLENQVNNFILNQGYEPVHLVYVPGSPLTVNRPTQLIDYAGSVYRVKTPASFPVVLSGTWVTDAPRLVDVGDASLRQQLSSILDSTLGSAMIGYRRPLPAAIGRALSTKLGDRVSVLDFAGSQPGTGVDNTPGIQAAIDFAGTFTGKYGCSVEFPDGDYRHTQLTMNKSHVKLIGYGGARLIHTLATNAGVVMGGVTDRTYGLSISGIAFANEVTGTSGAQIHAINCGQIAFSAVHILNFPAKPYNGLLLENVVQVGIENSSFAGCVNDGFAATDSVDIYLNSSRADENGQYGFAFRTCSGVYPSQCSAFGNTVAGGFADNSVTSPLSADGNAFHFWQGFIGDTSGGHNLLLRNMTNSSLTACWGSTQKGAGDFFCGITLVSCSGVTLNGCLGLNNNSNGLLITGASTGIIVNGGRYSHNGKSATAGNRNGIQIGSGCSVTLNATLLDDFATGAGADVKTQLYGLKCDSSVASLTLVAVEMSGNVTGPYLFETVPIRFSETTNNTGEAIEVPSATITTLPYFGDVFAITGTTNIQGIAPQWKGRKITLIFRAALTVGDTGALKLSSSFVTSANATLSMVSDGVNLYETSRSVNGA